jgi:SAM-dependent methyltransferase
VKVAAYHAGRHLAEHELLAPGKACPMCGSVSTTRLWAVQRDPDVVLVRCHGCRAVSVDRFPTPEALDEYYGSYYDDAPDDAVTTDDPSRLASRIASYVVNRSGGVRLLDLGGGDGSIGVAVLSRLATSGEVVVVDYDHRRRAAAPAEISLSQVPTLADVDGAFDVVVASAVLEHLPRPAAVLEELLGRVKPGGVFYARTPYVVPLIGVASKVGVAIDFTFPAHLFDLGSDYWARLSTWLPAFDEFEVLASRPSPVETGFRAHPARTMVSAVMKAPWRLFGSRWTFVGGWELAARRSS